MMFGVEDGKHKGQDASEKDRQSNKFHDPEGKEPKAELEAAPSLACRKHFRINYLFGIENLLHPSLTFNI